MHARLPFAYQLLASFIDCFDGFGQPVLDIKPYLPYSDSIEGASVPNWVKVCTLL